MKKAMRITHFDQQKKAKYLDLSFDDASVNSKGYSEDGTLLISISQGDQRNAFQLSVAEASLLKERLEYVLSVLSRQYIEIDEKASEERQKQTRKDLGKKEQDEDYLGDDL